MARHDIRITRDQNAYEVSVTDPEIAKKNESSDSYNNPDVEYSFETAEEVLTFVTSIIDKALPVDVFTRAFDAAAKEAKDAK